MAITGGDASGEEGEIRDQTLSDRRNVTILFADVSNSTALVREMDPEQAFRVLSPIVQLAVEKIQLYEGVVNNLAGDGLMATFGRLASQDDALHACYCAIAKAAWAAGSRRIPTAWCDTRLPVAHAAGES
jgi:class 3 adenylate cyclase